jgi:hypothetical protein
MVVPGVMSITPRNQLAVGAENWTAPEVMWITPFLLSAPKRARRWLAGRWRGLS